MCFRAVKSFLIAIVLFAAAGVARAQGVPDRVALPGHVPSVVPRLTAQGRLPATNRLALALGLPLRNVGDLERLLVDLYDPASPQFRRFLTPQEFTARFGPTEEEYARVQAFVRANGLNVRATHPNRLVLEVEGDASQVEQAFAVTLRTYRHPAEPRDFFAPDSEPSVPAGLPIADMWGLSDLARPRPLAHLAAPPATALNYNGSGPGGSYRGADFRNAYAAGSGLTGSGQTVAVAEFDGYVASDITSYEAQAGYANVPLQNILLDSVSGKPGYSGLANAVAEVSLDIELAIAMAPGMAKLLVYEGSSPYTVFNRIATDNTARQISCSWAWNYGPTHKWLHTLGTSTLDSILSQMVAQGQAFFQASGDSDAYTGSQALSSSSGPIPVDSPYVTSVGGTTLTMNNAGAAWSSETVWNWGNNQGSGGGISPNYPIPSWQTNVSMSANSGSTANRNIPDVAMTADAVYVIYNTNQTGYFGGTSCAAPLWAGFCALVNQQSVAAAGTGVGFLNPALYAIAAGANYTSCFHDITTGNNIGNNTPGLFNAVTNYDLATGLGTPNGVSLINALAPSAPYLVTQPAGQNVAAGANVVLVGSVGGSTPLSFQWLRAGTNLPAGGNVSGVNSNILSITSATTNNIGNYQLVAANAYGSVTSSVASVNVGVAPSFSAQPVTQTVFAGSNAVFAATVLGSSPLAFQWRRNGTNLSNGGGISGATSNVLTLTAVTTNSAGGYALYTTNAYGVATSSVATLAVVLPPAITSTTLTNRTAQCGSNLLAFSLAAAGTAPLSYRWSLDGVPVPGATNTTFAITNLHLPDHIVAVAVTNLYGSASSNAVISVFDTLPPAITLNGSSPAYVELGAAFADPGATAADACAGAVPVTVNGFVNTNALSTNTLTYSATDGHGNTNTATRLVIVRDTTPPAITWTFTNLVLVADANCTALLPDVTGANYLLATDLSGPCLASQDPTNAAPLPLGTNRVILTVTDSSGNAAMATNQVIVLDQTPPQIGVQPQSQTNLAGATAVLSASATACTPLQFQWYRNQLPLPAETNATLALSNLTQAAAGDYFLVAAAGGGASTSAVATLTVNLNPVSLALVASANPAGYLDSLSFTAALTPTNVAGSVEFQTNGGPFDLQPILAGSAVGTNGSLLPRGTILVTAIFPGNAWYLPATNVLTQVITNHPPAALPFSCIQTPGVPLEIALTNLAANWSDADADPVSLVAFSISTNGITLTNAGDALVYFNTNNVADQFTCTIADDFGGTNIQTVTIGVPAPPDTQPRISVAPVSSDGLVLSLGGAPGYAYILEGTANLLLPDSWQPLATNILGTNGVWQFTDPEAAVLQQRFYRLKLAP
jgi:subtilase family serine protease